MFSCSPTLAYRIFVFYCENFKKGLNYIITRNLVKFKYVLLIKYLSMRLNSKFNDIKLNLVKVIIIGIPSYSVAIFSEKIVYVVPTIAMMMMIANSVEMGHTTSRNRIDSEDSLTEEEGAQQSTDSAGGI